MNRRLVLLLSLLGPVMGGLIVLGAFPQGADRFAWAVVNVACAFAVARARVQNVFWHGAVAGFLIGASATLVQGVFVDTYVANNPWVLDAFAGKSESFDLEYFIMMLVPFIGVAGALLMGALSLLADRALRTRERR